MPSAFAGCLRTPLGGIKKTLEVMSEKEELFGCRRLVASFQHINCFVCCLSLSLLAYLQAELVGRTVRSMPWKVLDQLVILFLRFTKETLGQPHGTMPKPLIRLLRSFGRRALYGRRRSPYGRPGAEVGRGLWTRILWVTNTHEFGL